MFWATAAALLYLLHLTAMDGGNVLFLWQKIDHVIVRQKHIKQHRRCRNPPLRATEAFHFFVELFYKETTILSTMRFKLKN
ncbi:hypothetical protein EGC86_11165 [Shewanella frigidimarina]|nr:hypothetical protein EGC86_11165 [Shewanella frigidimarina]